MAELADAQASDACGRKVVEVRILSSARRFWAKNTGLLNFTELSTELSSFYPVTL